MEVSGLRSMKIVFVGAGNLATNFAKALFHRGFPILQIYSRTEASAKVLAQAVEADYTTELADIVTDADLYIVALKDDALLSLLPAIVAGKKNALFVHTAGSIAMDVWKGHAERYGVFYPMQTFSKDKDVDFKQIPIFIESNSQPDTLLLKQLASVLSDKVYEATSEQRKSLHLAAVLSCNFTNHMYALAAKLLAKYNLPFDAMLPLIDETAAKAHFLPPSVAQTGPAVRRDKEVMDKHMDMLKDDPDVQNLYRVISESIQELARNADKEDQ